MEVTGFAVNVYGILCCLRTRILIKEEVCNFLRQSMMWQNNFLIMCSVHDELLF